ncbi:MAG: ligand-binding sensor domain-containing protein [Aureispira sp.]
MNHLLELIYLVLILALNISCVEKQLPEKEAHQSALTNVSKLDALKFNSGIRAILQDSKGNYWIGSHQEGVCVFDGTSFQYFTEATGLMNNQVRTIQEDKEGNIWFGTANGVCRYDGIKLTNYPTEVYASIIGWQAINGNLWFNAGTKAGVNWFDGQHLNYLAFPLLKNKSLDNSYAVTGISKDKMGHVWIATYAALFKFDGNIIHTFDGKELEIKKEDNLHIRSVLADSKGRIWIGNNGLGVLLFQENSVINFSDKNGLIHPNSSKNGNRSPAGTLEHVFVITEDDQGNIWFGDRDTGAWKFDGKTMTNYIVDAQLSTPMIWDIYLDKKKQLLFGMASGGVYQFNGESFDRLF